MRNVDRLYIRTLAAIRLSIMGLLAVVLTSCGDQRPGISHELCQTHPQVCDGFESELPAPADFDSFLFPGRADDLADGVFWYRPQKHTPGTQALGSDLSAIRLDGGDSSSQRDRARGNAGHLIYGKNVYAMADGEIVKCWRNAPENDSPPARHLDIFRMPGGGNELWVKLGDGSHVLYAHFMTGSIPAELCPIEKALFDRSIPAEVTENVLFSLNVAPSILDIDETELATERRRKIKTGDFLGRVGNSGRSDGPHLHVHHQRNNQAAPINFYGAWIKSTVDVDEWKYLNNEPLPDEGTVIWPLL